MRIFMASPDGKALAATIRFVCLVLLLGFIFPPLLALLLFTPARHRRAQAFHRAGRHSVVFAFVDSTRYGGGGGE